MKSMDVLPNAAQQHIQSQRSVVVAEYDARWQRMLHQWNTAKQGNFAWLMYSANYLFNNHGLKWALDPMLLRNRVPESFAPDAARDMRDLAFVLLTHSHEDHVDRELWARLINSNCHWIVPEHMLDLFLAATGKAAQGKHTVAVSGREINLHGASIIPFDAFHGEYKSGQVFQKVPATGYHMRAGGTTLLFPGDVRTYNPTFLKPFAGASTVFAHLFLGRSSALMSSPPLLAAFITFYLASRPQKIVLSHLYEFGRDPVDCWRADHAEMVAQAFAAAAPGIAVETPAWYERICL